MIDPGMTFNYRFEVQDSGTSSCKWIGRGAILRAPILNAEPLAGSNPQFKLDSGWLMLLPTDGWARSFPTRWFSDQPKISEMDENARLADLRMHTQLFLESQKESWKEAAEKVSLKENKIEFMKEQCASLKRALQRRGLHRELASFSLFVGDSLGSALRTGDELRYSRDGNADFRFSVERNAETVFSAGTVSRSDPGGPMAIWQEYDRYHNPNAATLKKEHPTWKVAEWISEHRPYVTARVNEQRFYLLDGDEVHIDPYYVFLARSNQKVPPMAFEFTPRAVHAAGRLDVLNKDQIINAAQTLTSQRVRIL